MRPTRHCKSSTVQRRRGAMAAPVLLPARASPLLLAPGAAQSSGVDAGKSELRREEGRLWGALAGSASPGPAVFDRRFLSWAVWQVCQSLPQPYLPAQPSRAPRFLGMSKFLSPLTGGLQSCLGPRHLQTNLWRCCLSRQASWGGSKSSPRCLTLSRLAFRGSKLLPLPRSLSHVQATFANSGLFDFSSMR